MLNKTSNFIKNKEIIINTRCKNLIRHLKNGIWNKKKTSYARSPDNGHYDGIDALKYLVRNIVLNKNPYPHNYFQQNTDSIFRLNNNSQQPDIIQHFQKIFSKKKK